MNEVKTEKDMEKLMERVIAKSMPGVIKNYMTNIRNGIIIGYNQGSKVADVKLNGSGQILTNVKISKGLDGVISITDKCMVITTDPSLSNINLIIGLY